LTRDFIRQLDARSFSVSIDLLTPRPDAKRGSQVSIALTDAFSISQALIDAGIIVDFRAPDIIRFGFSPLYNTETDTTKALQALENIIDTRRFEAPQYQVRATVT
jgi:kynureninase